MKNYEVTYTSAADDIFIKTFKTEAASAKEARDNCKDERDVFAILNVIEVSSAAWSEK